MVVMHVRVRALRALYTIYGLQAEETIIIIWKWKGE
jgi:hypothetical protein